MLEVIPRHARDVRTEKKAGKCDCTGPPLRIYLVVDLSGRNQQTVGF